MGATNSIKFCLGFLAAFSFTACGAGIGKDKGDLNNQSVFTEKFKPVAEDFVGTPTDFLGSWSGPCRYLSSSGTTSDNCTMSVEFENSGGVLTGQARVVADGLTHVVDLKSYTIFGNELRNISTNNIAGHAGSSSVEINDSSFVQSAGKVVSGEFGFMMRSVPTSRSISYQLYGSLKKQ